MKKIEVYADFDWLKDIELIGELSYEVLRGSETYGFQFSNDWLKKYGDLFLSEDLNNYPGIQYTQQGKGIFGCFSDALPCLLYTSPSPRDMRRSRMPSSA